MVWKRLVISTGRGVRKVWISPTRVGIESDRIEVLKEWTKKRSFQRFVFDPQLTFIFLRLETTCFVVLHLLWQRFEIIPTPGMLSMLNSAVWINGGLPHVKWPFKSCKWWLRWILGYFGWFIWWNMMIFPLKRQMMIYTWLSPPKKNA